MARAIWEASKGVMVEATGGEAGSEASPDWEIRIEVILVCKCGFIPLAGNLGNRGKPCQAKLLP